MYLNVIAKFSPAQDRFINNNREQVDFGRVHIEEEGRVVSENLDSRNLLPDTCWQVRWIMGDGGFGEGREPRIRARNL